MTDVLIVVAPTGHDWATARASNNQHAEEGAGMAIDMAYALRETSGVADRKVASSGI